MNGRRPEQHTAGENHNPAGIGLLALLREDLRSHQSDRRRAGFRILVLHRLGNARMDLPGPARKLASALYNPIWHRATLRYGIELPYTVRVGRRVEFAHHGGIVINGWAGIGNDCVVRHGVTIGVRGVDEVDELPILADGVEVGVGAVILGGILVGEGSRIGANAVVVRDVPAGSTVAGVPARVISAPMQEGAVS